MILKKEEKSFSLGRLDIVDLYEWHKQNKLVYQTYFQRQSVWKEKDKRDLIDTIMKGYPIPAIFICDAKTNFESLSKTYNVLDGRQRLESIFEYLDNKFKYNGKTFVELSEEEKKCIVNYNVTLVQMYIEPDETEKIKEIFKRLNKNSYNLNRMEKQSTQLVEYDYMIISKIVSGIIQFENIESYLKEIAELFSDDDNEDEIDGYNIEEDAGKLVSEDIKQLCQHEKIQYINEILTTDVVFKHYDRQRQIALQYFLNIFACLLTGDVINRNVREKTIVELSAMDKVEMEKILLDYNKACQLMINLYSNGIEDFWRNKASFFTLSLVFSRYLKQIEELGVDEIKNRLENFQYSDTDSWNKYYEASNQGVNDKKIRELRMNILIEVLGVKE